jgi:protease-4
MKKRTAWVVVAAFAAVALGAVAVGVLALILRGGADTATVWPGSSAYLALDVEGDLPERAARDWMEVFGTPRPSLKALVEGVDRAASDSQVKGLVLRVGLLEAGWGRVQELRDAVQRFRATGKPTWAYMDFAGNLEYFLATGCERIAAAPTGMLNVTGLAAEVTFFKGTLEKVGVEADFVGVGKYKNAPNQFTETGFTEPHREQMESLVNSLFDQYVGAIAESRDLTEERVRAIIDDGPFDAEAASTAGLVDELLYFDEVQDRLPSSTRVGVADYYRGSEGFGLDGRPKVALVYAVGDIMPGESASGPFGGSTLAGAETISRGLRQATEDDSIRAIILRVDSPGGAGVAADAVWREMGRARLRKPVIASMGDAAASGGYYIAMNSDAIVAQPGTITGSIGVFSGKFSLGGLYEKIGISHETVRRGRHAAIFSTWEPWTEEERARIQSLNESFYDTFVTKAAEGRNRTPQEIEVVAQGRVWTGRQAVEKGLVDRLGGLEEAVAAARERAGIAADQPVRLVVLPARKGFLATLLERREEVVATRVLGPEGRDLVGWARRLGGRGPLARLPFYLRVR